MTRPLTADSRKGIPGVVVILETCLQADREKLDGISRYIQAHTPWQIHLIQNRVGEQRLSRSGDWKADGVIVGQSMLGMEVALGRLRVPLVLIDPLPERLGPGSPFARCDTVRNDAVAVGRQAADYFLSHGFRNFAYLGEALDRPWSQERGRGFAERLGEAGFECRVHSPLTPQEKSDWLLEQAGLARWLSALPKPTALFAAMDIRARQALDSCLNHAIHVPADIAILGVDNDEQLCLGGSPPLSSIACDMRRAGFLAAQLLDDRMDHPQMPGSTLTYGVLRIVERRSTGVATPITDQLAARALDFIRRRACEGIGVKDVVAHLKVSRRLVELRFRKTFGTSLLDEIRKVRLDQVQQLVAREVGTGRMPSICCGSAVC